MEKDKLEKFILDNREQLDAFEPDQKIWLGLEKKLAEKQQEKKTGAVRLVPLTRVWQIAASFALILVLMGLFQWQYNRYLHTQHPATASAGQTTVNASGQNELAEAEQFYISQIRQKQSQIKNYDLKSLGMDSDFEKDLASMDTLYKELKKELNTGANQEALINAMMQNMQMRIDILNQQLELLEKIKKLKNNKKNEYATQI